MVGDPAYDDSLVVLVTGTSHNIYHDLCDIIDGGEASLKLKPTDTIIVASPGITRYERRLPIVLRTSSIARMLISIY